MSRRNDFITAGNPRQKGSGTPVWPTVACKHAWALEQEIVKNEMKASMGGKGGGGGSAFAEEAFAHPIERKMDRRQTNSEVCGLLRHKIISMDIPISKVSKGRLSRLMSIASHQIYHAVQYPMYQESIASLICT